MIAAEGPVLFFRFGGTDFSPPSDLVGMVRVARCDSRGFRDAEGAWVRVHVVDGGDPVLIFGRPQPSDLVTLLRGLLAGRALVSISGEDFEDVVTIWAAEISVALGAME